MLGWTLVIAATISASAQDALPPLLTPAGPSVGSPLQTEGLGAPGQDAPATTSRIIQEAPTAMAIRGGASLGSYEAGHTYFLTRWWQANDAIHRRQAQATEGDARPFGAPFDVITGASAGGLNATLMAIAACQRPVEDPEASVFWTWTKVRVDPEGKDPHPYNLFRRDEVTARAAFTRQPFLEAAGEARTFFEDEDRWVDRPCAVDVGYVVSRVRTREVPLQRGLDGAGVYGDRQTEKFIVRLSREPGFAPKITPVVPRIPDGRMSPSRHLYLHLGLKDPGQPVPFDDLVQVLAATSGFPMAFEPVTIPHREWTVDGALVANERTEQAEFIDGGLLENLPLNLATRMSEWRAWEAGVTEKPARGYIVLDPSAEAWRRAEPRLVADTDPVEGGAVNLAMAAAGSFLAASQSAELLSAIDRDPELVRAPEQVREAGTSGDRLLLPTRRAVVASEWFFAFIGLFEQDFRVFDFYLGMLEARAWLRDRVGEDVFDRVASDPEAHIDSALFRCFLAWDEASAGFTRMPDATPQACEIYDSRLVGHGIARANQVPLLRAATAYRAWTEDEQTYTAEPTVRFDRWVAELDRQGFRWLTLDHSDDGDGIRRQLRAMLLKASRSMAREQSVLDGVLFSLATDVAADQYYYHHPRFVGWVGLNMHLGLELGTGVALGPWVRATVGMRLLDLGRKYGPSPADGEPRSGLVPVPLFRVEGTPMRSPVFQAEPWASYELHIPVTFRGELVGLRHAVLGGVNLVGLERIYGSIGVGGIVSQAARAPFVDGQLSAFAQDWTLQVSLGVRFAR